MNWAPCCAIYIIYTNHKLRERVFALLFAHNANTQGKMFVWHA